METLSWHITNLSYVLLYTLLSRSPLNRSQCQFYCLRLQLVGYLTHDLLYTYQYDITILTCIFFYLFLFLSRNFIYDIYKNITHRIMTLCQCEACCFDHRHLISFLCLRDKAESLYIQLFKQLNITKRYTISSNFILMKCLVWRVFYIV